MSSKQFGGKITKKWKAAYEVSEHWKNGKFQNLMDTTLGVNFWNIPKMLYRQLCASKASYPKQNLPIKSLDLNAFLKEDTEPKFVWYGHSVLLMRLQGKSILIDPMFGDDCSPIGPKRTKRFSANSLECINHLPEIDLVLITHDHYDHLDYDSMLKLKNKVKNYFVALGAKRHLVSWGIESDKIAEFDWWDAKIFENIQITFTPTRHFSGRGLSSMAKCLWGGWALKTENFNVWFSGDSGYGPHFKEIGNVLGPFDIGFMECGQYCEDWPDIHMFPNESVQAATDAGVKNAVPVHWGGFNLSYQHDWFEPPEAFMKFAQKKNLDVLTPQLGQVFSINLPTEEWWKNLESNL
ncbi:MAG TPA: MBL fold metallo-hydrolase [Saprospiraceae bacterium]|nr:MBL fold metallo-hydrolase [Saprospiraceae bacterium]HMQ81939.1 MBL fold metallo-hydrolase [Saprospiraceae bacterium]